MRRAVLHALLLILVLPAILNAQPLRVGGRVTDPAGRAIASARVTERGTFNTAITGTDGRYELRYGSPDAVLVFSAPGHRDEERRPAGAATLDVVLGEAIVMSAIEVVGTRRTDRSAVHTPVAVDVIDVAQVTLATGRLDVNRLLHVVAPSFNANRQSGADGSDHIDPASLRGLGPDQTLVLINGKRRHQSSLVNIFGARGRGNTGTDLNAIPVTAIERIEILRDGASAQYGSDAIAGVINIVLKSDPSGLAASMSAGAHNATPPSRYDVLSNGTTDGAELQGALEYGARIGAEGSLRLTGELLMKQRTNRPTDPEVLDIYRRQFGDAEASDAGVFANALLPLSSSTAAYAFGGINRRHTDAFAWTRDPDSERNVPAIYPDGFDPHITSRVDDASLSAGVRTRIGAWDADVNNTFGLNRFHYTIEGTLNASLLERSPTEFDAGGFRLIQNVTAIHVSRTLPSVQTGLHVALGAEHRIDSYSIFAGEEGSWKNYDPSLGRPGGAQGFPGFRPENELAESRSNTGAYADLELDLGERVLLGGAARFERYSDFGSTLTTKVAGRFSLSGGVAMRASLSTGFRAPSLAQVHFNSTYTDVNSGVLIDKVIARNGSALTRALGIPDLVEETARNVSAGIVASRGGLTATVDAYRVDVDDRIVLTGAFEDTDPAIGEQLRALDVAAAQFFTNAIDTRTLGVDVVLGYRHWLGDHALAWSLVGNFNDMELGAINTAPALRGKEDTYFGAREQAFLQASAPPVKLGLGLEHGFGRLQASARVVHYGRVTLRDFIDEYDVYHSKRTLDLAATWRASERVQVTLGGANILNAYPTQQDTETETGGVWDAVQMGFSGAFYFAKLSARLR
jgi:iron complex outermembrane receptor protein